MNDTYKLTLSIFPYEIYLECVEDMHGNLSFDLADFLHC